MTFKETNYITPEIREQLNAIKHDPLNPELFLRTGALYERNGNKYAATLLYAAADGLAPEDFGIEGILRDVCERDADIRKILGVKNPKRENLGQKARDSSLLLTNSIYRGIMKRGERDDSFSPFLVSVDGEFVYTMDGTGSIQRFNERGELLEGFDTAHSKRMNPYGGLYATNGMIYVIKKDTEIVVFSGDGEKVNKIVCKPTTNLVRSPKFCLSNIAADNEHIYAIGAGWSEGSRGPERAELQILEKNGRLLDSILISGHQNIFEGTDIVEISGHQNILEEAGLLDYGQWEVLGIDVHGDDIYLSGGGPYTRTKDGKIIVLGRKGNPKSGISFIGTNDENEFRIDGKSAIFFPYNISVTENLIYFTNPAGPVFWDGVMATTRDAAIFGIKSFNDAGKNKKKHCWSVDVNNDSIFVPVEGGPPSESGLEVFDRQLFETLIATEMRVRESGYESHD